MGELRNEFLQMLGETSPAELIIVFTEKKVFTLISLNDYNYCSPVF